MVKIQFMIEKSQPDLLTQFKTLYYLSLVRFLTPKCQNFAPAVTNAYEPAMNRRVKIHLTLSTYLKNKSDKDWYNDKGQIAGNFDSFGQFLLPKY